MIGTKLYKPLQDDYIQELNKGNPLEEIIKKNPAPNTLSKYTVLANWCNQNSATIEDKDEYYECVAIPAPSLDELKQAKIKEFKNKRDAEEVAPIKYDGHLFDFDDKARDRINAAIIALQVNGEGTAIEWTLADNTNTLVTYRDLMGVVASVASRSNKLHIKYHELKEKILAAATKEELDNIQWEE